MAEWSPAESGFTKVEAPGSTGSTPSWNPGDAGFTKVGDVPSSSQQQVSTPATDAAVDDLDKIFKTREVAAPVRAQDWLMNIFKTPLGQSAKGIVQQGIKQAITPTIDPYAGSAFAPQFKQIQNAALLAVARARGNQAITNQMIAGQLSPETQMLNDIGALQALNRVPGVQPGQFPKGQFPVGSKEWWDRVIPLGLEAAQSVPFALGAARVFGGLKLPRMSAGTEIPPVQTTPEGGVAAPPVIGAPEVPVAPPPAPGEPGYQPRIFDQGVEIKGPEATARKAAARAPETDEQALARATELHAEYKRYGGEPDAVFLDMQDLNQGQPPSWQEYADALEKEIRKVAGTPQQRAASVEFAEAKERGIPVEEWRSIKAQQGEAAIQATRERLQQTAREWQQRYGGEPLTTPQRRGGRYASRIGSTTQMGVWGEGGGVGSEAPLRQPGETPQAGAQPRPTGKRPVATEATPTEDVQQAGTSRYVVRDTSKGAVVRDLQTNRVAASFEHSDVNPAKDQVAILRQDAAEHAGILNQESRPPVDEELYQEAVQNVRKHYGLPDDPEQLREMQISGEAPSAGELDTIYDAEYKKLVRDAAKDEAKDRVTEAAKEQGRVPFVSGGRPGVPRVTQRLGGSLTPQQEAANAASMGMDVGQYRNWLANPMRVEHPGAVAEPPPRPVTSAAPRPTTRPQPFEGEFSTKGFFKKIGDSQYEHAPPKGSEIAKTNLKIRYNSDAGGWDVLHPNTGEVVDNLPTRESAMRTYYEGKVPEKAAPPAPKAAPTETLNKLFPRESIPAQGMTKDDMISRGREAIKAGVDPSAVSNDPGVAPDVKYAVVRAHGEDLREQAHAADQAWRANKTEANKRAANDAFWKYSDWDRYRGEQARKLAVNANPSMESEPEFNPQNFTDLREQQVRQNQKDFTPKQRAEAEAQVPKLQQAAAKRNAAQDAYENELKKLAPNPEEIRDGDHLREKVTQILQKKLPCND